MAILIASWRQNAYSRIKLPIYQDNKLTTVIINLINHLHVVVYKFLLSLVTDINTLLQ